MNTRSKCDDAFALLKSYKFDVPKGYQHSIQLVSFRKKYWRYLCMHTGLNDKDCANVSDRFDPGKAYVAKIFKWIAGKEFFTSEEALAFLKKQGSIYVGAQGLSLLMENRRFPKGKVVVAFDTKKRLPRYPNSGTRKVPWGGVRRGGGGVLQFSDFDSKWSDDFFLLGVCEK